ncbi:MAG: hypothetical protein A2Y38_13700 [Spirochaetes bacterium GWB1_59_5]|nr:MAG: hypothetical protein A2Y38_13700 [Spirochaetes bacterium GWB1_59_5]
MRRLGPLVAMAFQTAVALTVGAQELVVGPLEFSPLTFVPGEVVTAVAILDPGAAPWFAEVVASGFPEPGESEPRVLSVALEKRKGSPLLVARFVAWRAGPGYLPDLSVGGLDIPRLRFDCGSALADGDLGAPESLPQLNLPGLYTRLYVLAGLLLVAALVGITAATRAAPWFRAFKARRAYARARREFDELLDRLATAAAGPAVWAELCAGLRNFAGLRIGTDLNAMTASEVLSLPAGTVPGGVGSDLAGILAMGDEARFAGKQDLRTSAGVELARSVAARIDEALIGALAGSARMRKGS